MDNHEKNLKIEKILTDKNFAYQIAKTGNYNQAIAKIKRLIEICTIENFKQLHLELLSDLAEFYEKSGSLEKSLKSLKKKREIFGELSQMEIVEKTKSLEAEFDAILKDKEKELFELENSDLQEALKKLDQTYKELQRTQDQILKTEKFNAILATAVTANHQLNQPLMIVQGNVDMIYSKLPQNEKIDIYYNRINECIKKINKVIQDMDSSKN